MGEYDGRAVAIYNFETRIHCISRLAIFDLARSDNMIVNFLNVQGSCEDYTVGLRSHGSVRFTKESAKRAILALKFILIANPVRVDK